MFIFYHDRVNKVLELECSFSLDFLLKCWYFVEKNFHLSCFIKTLFKVEKIKTPYFTRPRREKKNANLPIFYSIRKNNTKGRQGLHLVLLTDRMTSKRDGGKRQDPQLLAAFLVFTCSHILNTFCFILIPLIILVLCAEPECFRLNMTIIRVWVHLCCHSSE